MSKHLNKVVEFDPASESILVEPGIALDQLNGLLNPHGLMFMVDVSTSSRATIGGMTGNNSCGSRSIRYGIMRDNVIAIDAILANGEKHHFGELPVDIEKAIYLNPIYSLRGSCSSLAIGKQMKFSPVFRASCAEWVVIILTL